MSRIGKMPIDVPKGVTVAVAGGVVSVKGPKGELKLPVRPEISVVVDGGTTRALLANMITGVTLGFEKKLDINGVGYEAEVKGKTLVLKLGFNRPVRYEVPATVTVEAPTLTSLVVRGIDNQQVGTVAAAIRKLRKPEPYKGKGIKYSTETIKRKAGKAFASGGGG
jgi:large subunit ribosomal protein L6